MTPKSSEHPLNPCYPELMNLKHLNREMCNVLSYINVVWDGGIRSTFVRD